MLRMFEGFFTLYERVYIFMPLDLFKDFEQFSTQRELILEEKKQNSP